jgi:hypothetical protein
VEQRNGREEREGSRDDFYDEAFIGLLVDPNLHVSKIDANIGYTFSQRQKRLVQVTDVSENVRNIGF